jgi:hypothetical protein
METWTNNFASEALEDELPPFKRMKRERLPDGGTNFIGRKAN